MKLGVPAALAALVLAGCGKGAPSERELVASVRGENVLVTLIDACAASHLPFLGYERDTAPFLARLAEESIVFTDATAPAPYTLASVASILTGEHVDVHGVIRAGASLPDGLVSLPEAFRAAGYRTHGLSTNAHVRGRFGFDRGFDRFEYVRPALEREEHNVVPASVLRAMEDFLLEEHERPFFAYWHLMPPHAPYDPPAPHAAAFAAPPVDPRFGSIPNLAPLTAGARRASRAEHEAIVALYDGAIRYVDGVLARVGATLERRGLADETTWIVLSDHGEAFGEHGLYQHSRTVHEEMVRVPWIVRLPGERPPARRIDEPVSLVDLWATLAELHGLDAPVPASSTSLVPAILGRHPERRAPVVSRTAGPAPHLALRRGDWKLIEVKSGPRVSLYDLASDPGERDDLASRRPELAGELLAELHRFREDARARRAEGRRLELTEEERSALAEMGYVEAEPPEAGEDG